MNDSIKDAFGILTIMKALLTGFIFSALIVFPFLGVLINWMLLYIYHAYVYGMLIVMLAAGWVVLWLYFYYKTLSMYQKMDSATLKKRFKSDVLMGAAIILIVGTIAVIYLVPRLT